MRSRLGEEPEVTESATDSLEGGRILERAAEVLRLESESIEAVADRLDESFVRAARAILAASGRVVVTGVGKSGLIARKVASTLASTGTPALFLHPSEGRHGDVGMLVRGDLLLAVSKSGESEELKDLLPLLRRLEIPIIALTAAPGSTLARHSDIVLDASVPAEACPHDLAPTSSSTAALALGDALAMVLLDLRGFGAEDFARLHPGGELGRRLLLLVEDVMVVEAGQVPRLSPEDDLAAAMHEIAHRRGTVPVVDVDDRVIGIVTAGDLTRYADRNPDFLRSPVRGAMNDAPRTVGSGVRAAEALAEMRRHGIMALPVVGDDARLVGMVHLHDLLRSGIS